MSRVYASREDNGDRILVYLECDYPGCVAKLRPSSVVSQSGWTKLGHTVGSDNYEYHYCDEHGHST